MITIAAGVSKTLLDAVTGTGAGTAYALPESVTQVSWQTVFGTTPDAAHFHLEASNDNTNWSEIDASSSVTPELRTVNTSALFIRANLVSKTNGTTFSVTLVAKRLTLYPGLTDVSISNKTGPNSNGQNIWIGGGGANTIGDPGDFAEGSGNTAVGYLAMRDITVGKQNTAVGDQALRNLTTGDSNTVAGLGAAVLLTTGSNNTVVGFSALHDAVDADASTAVGFGALNKTTADACTAVGVNALVSNVSGTANTSVGYQALYSALGASNVAIGAYAGQYETGADSLYIDDRDRTNTAGDKAKALIYGIFADTAAAQRLRFNAAIGIGKAATATSPLSISGLPTSSAGLVSGDVWLNSNVLTIVP